MQGCVIDLESCAQVVQDYPTRSNELIRFGLELEPVENFDLHREPFITTKERERAHNELINL